MPQRAQAVSGGTGAANLGQSHCPGPWSQLCLGGWTGAKGHCCLSPLQGQGVCAVPQLSPELLSFSAEGGEGSVPCRICPCQGRGQQCWDMILSIPGHTTVPGVPGAVRAFPGHSRQKLPAGRNRDELILYSQHREQEGLPQMQVGPGAASSLSPPKLGWPCRVSTVGHPQASLFAASVAHVTRVSHVPCPLSCRHPSAGRAPHGQHGGHCLQQALSDQ